MTTSASAACDQFLQLVELALADVGGGIDLFAPLGQAADDDGAGGGGQAAQFLQRIVADPGPVRQGHADQEGPFQMDRQFIAGDVERHVG